jgi:hypothetical protein
MGDFLLEMEWLVCIDGYHIGPAPKGSGDPDSEVLRANSKYHRGYKPFQKYENLYSAFAQLKTRDDLLKFVNRFGELSSMHTVENCLRTARDFHELLVAKQTSTRKIWATFRRQTALSESRSSYFKGVSISRLIEADFSIGIGSIDLAPDQNEGVRLKIEPRSLLAGLWMQLARKLTQRTIVRTCRYCGSIFEAGAGSKRRSDATFCCAEHSVRFHSLKRSKGV